MADRYQGHPGGDGQGGAAAIQLDCGTAGGDTRAFRIDQHIHARGEAFLALLHDLPQGVAGVAPIDGDRGNHRQPPAEKGDTQQFLLEDRAYRAQRSLQIIGFPAGLMLAERHERPLGQSLDTLDFQPHTAAQPQPAYDQGVGQGGQALPWALSQGQSQGERQAGKDHHDRDIAGVESQRTQRQPGLHGRAPMRASAAAARSS